MGPYPLTACSAETPQPPSRNALLNALLMCAASADTNYVVILRSARQPGELRYRVTVGR